MNNKQITPRCVQFNLLKIAFLISCEKALSPFSFHPDGLFHSLPTSASVDRTADRKAPLVIIVGSCRKIE